MIEQRVREMNNLRISEDRRNRAIVRQAAIPYRSDPFLRKPYVELSARQRKCPVIKLYPTPQSSRLIIQALPSSLSRRLFGRISGQFCSM